MDEVRRLAHDVRAPLHAARLAAKALRAGYDEAVLDDLENSLDAILAVVRPERVEVVDVVACAREVVAGMRVWLDTEGAQVEIAGTYPVRAGRGRVQRVVQNLVHNAATHGGGRIRVWVDDGLHIQDEGGGSELASPGEGLGMAACEEWVVLDSGTLETVESGHIRVTWPEA